MDQQSCLARLRRNLDKSLYRQATRPCCADDGLPTIYLMETRVVFFGVTRLVVAGLALHVEAAVTEQADAPQS
jgi:hypothetical protein